VKPRVYYNEIDPFAAEWLRELIKAGHISEGDVDERDIRDVIPADLARYDRCHFFSGIGIWEYALLRAKWPAERRVWTGSCPCQPFSAAGKGVGFDDERHLWPDFFYLIEVCRPDTILGEQVASADGLTWLDLVSADMEGIGYTVGAVDFPSASVGSPHNRQRLYFVANAERTKLSRAVDQGRRALRHRTARVLGNTDEPRSQGRGGEPRQRSGQRALGSPSLTNGFWRDAEWIFCRDGKTRPIPPQSAFFPLVNGNTAGRVGLLRGAGNAINAEAAKAFIESVMENL